MPNRQAPLAHLKTYLPEGTDETILQWLVHYKVHLTITRPRKTILGDYRHRTHYSNHRISVNGNLDIYSFLITLVHELAHLLVFEQYHQPPGSRGVAAHGREWQKIYAGLLSAFLNKNIFPAEIENELKQTLRKPAANSCAEDDLVRVLRKYDKKLTLVNEAASSQHKLVEEIPTGGKFRLPDGRIFQRGEKLRKRFKCVEVGTRKVYLFSPVHEVVEMSRES